MSAELYNEIYDAYRTRDRGGLIAAIRKLLGLFKAIDLEKIRGILESIDFDQIMELINLIGGIFGASPSATATETPTLDLEQCVAEASGQESDVSSQAIDIGAIVAIVQLIIAIVARLRGEEVEV